jgi:chemotaxis signal transduction protein
MSERTFVQFRAGDSVYGLAVASVVEIIRIAALAPVPDPAPDLIGMLNVRGLAVPVFDLYRSLHGVERPLSLRMYIVIVEVEDEPLGVVVDDVLGVVTVATEHFRTSRALASENTFTSGIARVGSEMLTVLNLAPLLDRTPGGRADADA